MPDAHSDTQLQSQQNNRPFTLRPNDNNKTLQENPHIGPEEDLTKTPA